MRSPIARAAALLVASLAGQLGVLLMVRGTSAGPLRLVDTALLLAAASLLGSVAGLRQRLAGGSQPALVASLVPLLACALFLSPRLAAGAPPDALLALATCAASVAPVELAWSAWLAPTAGGWGYVLRPLAPALATSLAALSTSREPLVLVACAAALALAAVVGALARRDGLRVEAEARRFTRQLRSIEVRGDTLVVPELPPSSDPWLAELALNLRERARLFAEEARASARAEREIAEARQLRTRFMASMSHELRSPLNSVVGFAQVLEDELDGDLLPEQRESVKLIRRSAEELIRLLTDTLDLARLEAGKLRLSRRWVPSVEILTEAVVRGRALVEGRDVEIEAELQPGLPPVYVDSRRIVQAVVALIHNAARSLRRARVRLRARVALGPPGPAQHLRVEFYDAVGALPEAQVERIFEAFQEITAPTGRRVGGLGMSLSLSRALVRLHGGDIWADSTPGAGTVLCVALPLDAEEGSP